MAVVEGEAWKGQEMKSGWETVQNPGMLVMEKQGLGN